MRERGALLTEVLIALALMIPVVILVAGLFPYSFSVDRRAWTERAAHNIARSVFERARGSAFDTVVSETTSVQVDEVTFTAELQVDELGTPPDVREKRLRCTVTWPVSNGTRSVQQETRIVHYFNPDE